MADNTTTYTTIIDTQVTGGDELKNLGEKAQENDTKFKSLRAQIRETTVALQQLADAGKDGTQEFEDLRSQLDELNDAQEKVSFQAGQFDDQLAALPGPLGAVGQGIQSFNEGLNRFSTGFKVAFGVVGLIVAAFAALKESLSRTEEGQKKLTQITESFTKILNGLFAIIEPIAMALADLVIQFLSNDKVLKVLSKTFATAAAIIKGTFVVVKELAMFVGNNLVNTFKTAAGIIGGFGKVLKGVFTFDVDAIKEGLSQVGKTVTTGVSNFVSNVKDRYKGIKDGVTDAFVGAEVQFAKGSKRLTELEKKNADEAKKKGEEAAKAAEEARKKALEEKLKALETEDKLDEARLNKMKENALAAAKTDEERLAVEQAFLTKSYELRRKDILDKQSLYDKNSNEFKAYQAELINLEATYVKDSANLKKQKEENDKKALEKQIADIQSFNDRVAEINLSALKDETLKAEVAREQKRNKDKEALMKDTEFLKLTVEEQNAVLRQLEIGFQNDIAKIKEDARVKENEKRIKAIDEELRLLELTGQTLLADTKAYYENRAAVLDAAEQKELQRLDITENEKTKIKEKYQKLREQLDQDEMASNGKVISATLSALSGLTGAIAASYDEEAKTSKEAFEKRKKLQKATAIMSAASGIVQILTQPSTLPSPFDFIVKGINAAALAVSTAVQIKQINATQFEGGGAGASASGGSQSVAKPALPAIALPTIETKGAPTVQGTTTGTNPTQQLAGTLAQRTDKPIKAYVVSGDVSSQQALDRRTSVAATFG
jgi:DNA repair exonuclease SbcCD ATPase subunit